MKNQDVEKENEQKREEREAFACWLDSVPSIGRITAGRLLAVCKSPKEIYRLDAGSIEELTEQRLLTHTQAASLRCWQKERDPDRMYREMKSRGIRCVLPEQEEYPDRLRRIADPPRLLYVKGALPEEGMPSVGIVGARLCSDYGRYAARQFAGKLACAGIQIVSGMALGIDGIGHKAALSAGGCTFAVLGCGVDICYPEENREIYDRLTAPSGILSEYPPGTVPKSGLFPPRNRIISGLSDVLLVVEARKKSGTLITVDQALEQGKEVYALPGRVTDALSYGCNNLIRQGAGIAMSPEELIEAVFALWERQQGKPAAFSGERERGKREAGQQETGKQEPIAREKDKQETGARETNGQEKHVQETGAGERSEKAGTAKRTVHGMDADERSVYGLLSEEGQTMDMLMGKAALSAGDLSAALVRLCVRKAAVCERGRYRRNDEIAEACCENFRTF